MQPPGPPDRAGRRRWERASPSGFEPYADQGLSEGLRQPAGVSRSETGLREPGRTRRSPAGWGCDQKSHVCVGSNRAISPQSALLAALRWDVQKEGEPHVYLSKEEVKEKIQSYNSSVTDKLKMTLNANGIYTGFIKVQMELCRPITVQSSQSQGRCAHSNNDTAFYLPDGCVNTLHISSTNTVREVIEALLKKFFVADNPAKFALYKRCHKEDQVYTCKLSDREHPLYLRLVAGPRTEMLSFVLREHETGEVLWEAFTIPELQNFLRILDKEENEQLQILKKRYAAYRDKLEEALGGVWKPD
ncbi:ras association domain-containing protein 3 [Antrostomus carolinensis]|uniref:ras association domain-containing protein 3 n=1 Tax=Antrostomus carolinensis TaxID=279965 RepID=UPI000528E53C|nr:ras association domain-containing protein 3 [Antrostomus carolinensis]